MCFYSKHEGRENGRRPLSKRKWKKVKTAADICKSDFRPFLHFLENMGRDTEGFWGSSWRVYMWRDTGILGLQLADTKGRERLGGFWGSSPWTTWTVRMCEYLDTGIVPRVDCSPC